MEFFTIKMHHDGQLAYLSEKAYVKGIVEHLDNCDINKWGSFDVEEIVQKAR